MRARDRLSFWLLTAVVAIAVLAIGGALRWAVCAMTAAALVAVLPQARSSRSFEGAPPLLTLIAVAAGLTAIQLIPLPAALVAILSPGAADNAADNAATLAREAPGFIALSLDPAGTLVELCKLAGYFAFAWAALRLAVHPRGRARLLRVVAVTGAAVAVIGVAHHLVGAATLFGVYTPERATPYLAPLLNPNHFAGLLALSACVSLGLALDARGTDKAIWLVCGAVAVAGNLLSQSRGGVIVLAVGLAITAGLFVGRRKEGRRVRVRKLIDVIPAVIVALCVLVLIVTFTSSGVAVEFATTEADELAELGGKVRAWESGATLLEEHAFTGVGRGAFETAFTRVHEGSHRKIFSHLENEYLQAAVDWGVIGASVLAILLGLILVQAARRVRSGPLTAGAAGGLCAVGLQNLADFSLQLPGVVLPVLATAATLTHVGMNRGNRGDRGDRGAQGASASEPRRRGPGGHRVQVIRLAGVATGAVLVALAASPMATSVRADGAKLAAALDGQPTAEEILDAGSRVMTRHPSDYWAPAQVARSLFRMREPRAVAFANRALRLHPSHAGVNRLVARMLLAAGKPDQACLQYRLAIRYANDLAPVIAEVVERFPEPERAAGCMPADRELATDLLDGVIRGGHDAVALGLARRLDGAFPDRPAILERLGQLELRDGDRQVAESHLRRAHELAPTAAATIALVELFFDTGRGPEAERTASDALSKISNDREKMEILVRVAEGYGESARHDDAKRVLTTALDLVRGDRRLAASIHGRLSRVEQALGNPHRAEWEASQARSLSSP